MQSSRNFVLFAGAIVCLAGLISAAPHNNNNNNYNRQLNSYRNQDGEGQRRYQPANEQQVDADESGTSEINDESGAVDPEFASLTDDGSPESAASNTEMDEADEASAPSAGGSGSGNSNSAGYAGDDFSGNEAASNQWLGGGIGAGSTGGIQAEFYTEPRGQDSNIANAKVRLSSADMSAAAGHHYGHHGHGVHGWLEMGAHTGKKGAFGWHDKHPVGGKGRR